MLLPYTVDVPMTRLPFANWALIAATLVISLTIFAFDTTQIEIDPTAFSSGDPKKLDKLARDLQRIVHDPAAPPLSLQRSPFAVSQLFTYVLVHGGVLHLVANMVFLFCFGNAINAKLGHLPFLAIYFLLGALAGLAWLLAGEGKSLVGASGAIMGITGVFFIFYPRNDVSVLYLWSVAAMGTFTVSSYWIVLLCLAADLLGTLIAGGGGIAYVCHLAGTLSGGLLAVALLFTGLVRSTSAEENVLQAIGLQRAGEQPVRGVRGRADERSVPARVKRRRAR